MQNSLTPGTWCPLRETRCSESCNLRGMCSSIFAAGRLLVSHSHSQVIFRRNGGTLQIEKTVKQFYPSRAERISGALPPRRERNEDV